jgi:hypothetical protein
VRRANDDGADNGALSSAELRGEIDRLLAKWRCTTPKASADVEECITAAVRAVSDGWIALLDDGRLVAWHRDDDVLTEPTESADAVARALASAHGPPRGASSREYEHAMSLLERWLARDWAQRSCGLASVDTPVRRRVLRAIDAVLRRAPRHRRAEVLPAVACLRRALAGPLPLGLERALDALVAGDSDGWLARATGLLTRDRPASHAGAVRQATARAFILLGPDATPAGT